jgi:hypothetical protein
MAMKMDEFQKSLAKLDNLAKGTQLFNTPSSSQPGTWAGSAEQDVAEDDKISDNGTDYQAVKKSLADKVAKGGSLTSAETAIVKGQDPRKLIADKIVKGQALTPAETWVAKGGFMGAPVMKSEEPGESKDANSVPETHVGGKDDEKEGDAKKSLETAVDGSEILKGGFEVSPFLFEMTKAIGEALKGTEARTQVALNKALGGLVKRIDQLEKSLGSHVGDQSDFNKSLAEAVVGIAQHTAVNAEVVAKSATAPARGAKSELRTQAPGQVTALNKSFGPGGLDVGSDAISKSQLLNVMVDMCKGGELAPRDVVKFETTGELSDSVRSVIHTRLNSR